MKKASPMGKDEMSRAPTSLEIACRQDTWIYPFHAVGYAPSSCPRLRLEGLRDAEQGCIGGKASATRRWTRSRIMIDSIDDLTICTREEKIAST